jgi:hypothetical protein
LHVVSCSSRTAFSEMPSIPRVSVAISAILVIAALFRIVSTYRQTAQAFDEPCHIAAGIEFLDHKTYSLDPVHPPLSRIAIGLPVYLAGERFPHLQDPDANYNVVGNHILNDSGHFQRNLTLARIGVLPFFILGAVVVYLWTMRIAGERAALFAVFLYTTTPTILAFSSIAYTDIVAASTQLAALFALTLWLEAPTRSHILWLALTLSLAFLAKLTTVLFIPAAGVCMIIIWWLNDSRPHIAKLENLNLRRRSIQILGALALAALIVWGCYRFSIKPVQQVTGLNPNALPAFTHFPAPARSLLQKLIVENPPLPAPELLNGIAHAWVLNKATATSFLFGHTKVGGWWYFYLCALCVKLPLPLLILFAIGVALLLKGKRKTAELFPLAGLIGILLITTHVNYQVGSRHILVCLPLISIVAATGLKSWLDKASWRSAATLLLVALSVWQIVENVRAQADFLAYFNEFAGSDPGKVLSTGCDLDCGQDLYKLADVLRARHASRVTLAVWTSADLDHSGLPPYDLPGEGSHAQGWIAVSSRAFYMGDFVHQSVPLHSFDWLEKYPPVATVGKTIRLYYVDPTAGQN